MSFQIISMMKEEISVQQHHKFGERERTERAAEVVGGGVPLFDLKVEGFCGDDF